MMKLPFFLLVLTAALSGCSTDPATTVTTPTAAPTAPARQGLVETVQLTLQRLDTLTLSGNRDQDFALIMALHRRTALRLARLELERGQDSVLRGVARELRAREQPEIQQLRLATARLANPASNYNPRNPQDAFVRRSAAALDTLLRPIGTLRGSVDQDFATLLLAHHQALVVLARAELALGRDAGMQQLAQVTLRAQPAQVRRLRQWQAAHAVGQ
jgi:uncharacterized protein (DUF305 family)